jgi:hypothetical protein
MNRLEKLKEKLFIKQERNLLKELLNYWPRFWKLVEDMPGNDKNYKNCVKLFKKIKSF